MIFLTPMMTQSVGVPFNAKWRGPISRKRSGSLSDSEWATPDWSFSGATTVTSSDNSPAIEFEELQSRRVDAVVIGEQDSHGVRSSHGPRVEASAFPHKKRFV